MESRFGAHFEKTSEKTAAGYLMSHTVSVFGLDAKGQTRTLIDYGAERQHGGEGDSSVVGCGLRA